MNENLTKLEFNKDIYVADNMESLVYLLKTKPRDYRILIDNNAGLILISPLDKRIHIDLIWQAAKEGWYAEYFNGNTFDDADDYFYEHNGVDIFSIIFSLDKDKYLNQDGNQFSNEYDFGFIYTKDYKNELPDNLTEIIGKPKNILSVKDSNKEEEVYDEKRLWNEWTKQDIIYELKDKNLLTDEIQDILFKKSLNQLKDKCFNQIGNFYSLKDGNEIIKNLANFNESFGNKTGMPYYDEENPNKLIFSQKIKMTPAGYIETCVEGFNVNKENGCGVATSYDILYSERASDKKRIEHIKDVLLHGEMDVPVLEYIYSTKDKYRFTQEGIHRAISAKELGYKQIPVKLYVSKATDADKEVTSEFLVKELARHVSRLNNRKSFMHEGVDSATITQVLNQKELINLLCKYRYEYRIIYDSNKDWYLIGTAFDNCHETILYNCAAYYGLDFNGMTDYYDKHYMDLHDLMYTPKEDGLTIGFDHNDRLYTFKGFGSIYTKGDELPDVLLLDLIGRFGKPNTIFKEAVAEKEETLPELNDNFWRWFGDSVVKDDDGNPLICFHGSTLDIDEFSTEYSGNNTGNNEEKVFYFTTDREMAVSYSTEAAIRQKEIPYYDKEEGTEYETWEEFEEYLRKEVCKTPHINPCFICMEKPYIYDAGFRDFDPKLNYTLMSMIKGEIDTSHWLYDEELYLEIANEHEEYDEETDEYIQIKDFDYDGIIIKNVRDTISPLVDKYCDEYIVWSPTQIKSIYNKGNWSWNSRNVFEALNREIERYL